MSDITTPLAPRDALGAPSLWSSWPRLLNVAVFALLAVLPILVPGFWVYSLALVMAQTINILAISFLIRFTGEVSIGHNFFIAFGAYSVATLQYHYGLPILLGVIVAVCFSTILGALFALPSRGLSGVYLSVVTLALGLCVPEILLYGTDFTGGFEGIFLDNQIFRAFGTDRQNYYIALLGLAMVVFVLHRFRHSRIGLAVLTVRAHPHAGASFGMTVALARVSAFALSAGIAGFGGSMVALVTSMVSPNSFTFFTSITLLVGAVVSLYSLRLYGAIIGGAFITVLPQVLSGYGQIIQMIYGGALVLFIVVANVIGPWALRALRKRNNSHVE